MSDAEPTEIDVHEAKRRADAGAALVDVREEREHAEVRVPDARLVPMSAIVQHLGEIPRDREVLVMCRTGGRSERVAAYLRGLGVDAVNVDGGIEAWEAEGLPVERG